MGYLEISLLLLLFPSLLHCKQYTLNVPRVLLPYVPASGVKSNFTLKSEHGCFSWKSTKPDVATVDPVYITTRNGLKCSREAVLTPQSTTSTRLSTVIVATEEATSLILRSDVYVDTINRIEITTRTRELLLEEEPEKFEVRAFDSEGNMFSTVRGHVFEWTLLRDDEAVHQQLEPDAILTFVEFQDSAYSTDPIIGQLEDMHLQGDEVLVAGVNTGTAKVQVRLVETAWKYVLPYVVKLLVIESLILFPSEDMYIMPFSFIDYHVERKKHGKMEVVMMPSDQYRLELTNVTVCSLDRDRSRATGMVIGDTQIVLHDKNMFNIPQATKPSSDIHVVFPHRIGFSVFPGNNWVLQVNREYTIAVNLFDKNNRNIFVTENVLLESAIPNEHFLIYFSSINGSHYFVKTIKTGTTTLTSSIDKLKHPVTNKLHSLSSVITKSQLVEIVEPVVVLPKVLMLLSDKKSEQVYQHTMKATGGSGKYQWNSDTVDVVGVSRLGVVTSVHPGKAIITVSDVRNSDHFDQALVYVVPPSSVGFVTSPVEVVVGQYLLLPLQVMGLTIDEKPVEVPFYDCRYMQFKLTLTDEAIFNASMSNSDIGLESIPEGACTFVKVFALKPGHTKLTVLYDHGSIHLETSITIASYPSLRPVDPETIAVVTLGSSKTVVFEGGPSAWVLDPSQYDRTLTPERSSDVVITTLPPSTLTQHTIRVTCLVHGIQDLTLSVKNEPTAKNPIPASETTTIKISCALPVSMAIKPVVKEMTDCPLLRGTNQDLEFPVHNGAPLQLEVTVFDRERRQFDNFSSLQWTWSSSDDTLLSLTLDVINNVQHFGHKAILSVGLSQRSGSVTITTSSNSHVTKILEQERIDFKDPFSPKVNYSLSLLLKSAVSVSPEELLVYNHPKNMATLTVLHGSRHFRVDHIIKPRPPVADVEYIKESQSINIHPLGEGQIRITIHDLCLPVPDVTVMVYVATIHSIQVKVPDKVQVGNSIFAYVRLLDNRAKPFPSDQHHLMKLQSNPKTEHIEIKPATNGDVSRLPASETSISLVYVVEGVTMGMALLLYNATVTTGKVITSWPAEIQVFDALRLTPKNITLIPTATFQIRSFGGPVHQTSIIYAIDNITVATVDQSGLITATVPGNAIVTGKAQSQDSTNPSGMTTPTNLIYSSDTVVVKVVKLTGIKIVVPSKKLVAGEEIAVYVEGENESETPFSFASGIPSLTFHWSVSNMDVLSLVSVYDQAGVSLQEERDFPTLLRTRNPGQGVIQVSMKCPPGFCIPDEGTFNDQVDIRVFSLLKLINPSDGHLLLPQNGNTRIRTNRDGSSHS